MEQQRYVVLKRYARYIGIAPRQFANSGEPISKRIAVNAQLLGRRAKRSAGFKVCPQTAAEIAVTLSIVLEKRTEKVQTEPGSYLASFLRAGIKKLKENAGHAGILGAIELYERPLRFAS